MDLVAQAMSIAGELHSGQYRKYGTVFGFQEPYINHPARVAASLVTAYPRLLPYQCFPHNMVIWQDSYQTALAAAWLHDVIEDCQVDVHELVNLTSPACVDLIQELTNPSKAHPSLNRFTRKQMDRDHIKTISKNAKLIKMLDRIDNILGIVNAPKDFALLYLRESRSLAEVLIDVHEPTHTRLTNLIETATNCLQCSVG